MRRRLFHSGVALVAVTVMAFGCGISILGADAPTTTDGGDGSASLPPTVDGQQQSDSRIIESDGGADASSEDAPSAGDASTDAPDDTSVIAEASVLPPATPGVVMCNGNACAVPAQFCCIGTGACAADPAGCGTFKHVECDEPADCPNKCCLTRNSAEADNASTRCQADCSSSPGGVRVCRTSADCSSPTTPCLPVQCLGFTFGTCDGAIPPTCIDGGL